MVSITLHTDSEPICIEGTIFSENDPRIVSIDGFRIDAIPSGHMLISRNLDRPGVIGLIGTILGNHGINIGAMFNSRETIGGSALTVYEIDDPISTVVRDQLILDDRITDIYCTSLDS
jgi:D-3-phosphoglycerate dehydrogenase